MTHLLSSDGTILQYDKRTLEKVAASHLPETKEKTESTLNLPTDIPDDVNVFYPEMGFFINQKTNEPVTILAEHQLQTWYDRWISKYRLYLKSQKIGISTMILLEDIHIALTRGKGKEILIVSQSKDKAKDHLQDIQKMLRNSAKYKDYLLDTPKDDEQYLRDERTKVDTIYLRNPDDPKNTTKIIALGITSAGSLVSFKKVCHIHLSDITMADMVEERFQEAFGALFSRLANTDGTIVIEAPPRGTSGPVFDIVDEMDELKTDGFTIEIEEGKQVITPSGFLVRRFTYMVGVACGMITEEFIEKERRRLGVLFAMYYMADFYTSDKAFFDKDYIKQTSQEATDIYGAFDRIYDEPN